MAGVGGLLGAGTSIEAIPNKDEQGGYDDSPNGRPIALERSGGWTVHVTAPQIL